MARKSKEQKANELVTYWTGNIKAGAAYRKKYTREDQWEHYRQMYRGNWRDDIIPVNRIFSFGRSLVPSVYFRSPYVTITPLRAEFIAHARVLEAVDNWLIQETMLKKTLKKACLDTYITGTGVVKLGYDSEFGFLPDLAVDQDAGTATQYGKSQRRNIEYRTNVKTGMPWALPVSLSDIFIPYGYHFGTDLPWIAHRILRPLEDVKQDQKYANTQDLTGTKMSNIYGNESQKVPFEMNEIPYAELYEIRDCREKRIITICENKILLQEDDILQIEGVPYEFMIFNEDPEHFFGISDVQILEPQQRELNEVKTQQSKHRKIALIKFLAKKGVLDPEMAEHFLSGKVGPFVEVDDEQILAAITTLQPHVPPELSAIAQEVRNDMRESLGFSENQLGEFSPYHGKTATETMQVAESYDNRINDRKDIVADVFVNIIKKFNQMLFKFWDTQRVVEVAGQDGAMGWVEYTGQMLEGEYAVKIDPESGFPISKSMRSQIAGELMKTYNGDMVIDQMGLRKQHLQTFEWIFPGISQTLIPGVNPMLAQDLANQRQPGVEGGGGNPLFALQGNRGGGRQPGSTQNVVPFDKFKQGFNQKK